MYICIYRERYDIYIYRERERDTFIYIERDIFGNTIN